MTDKLFLFAFVVALGILLYFLLFRQPESNMLFSSDSREDISRAQAFLTESGIQTYMKNPELNRFSYYGTLPEASLHVVDAKDRERAMRILESRK